MLQPVNFANNHLVPQFDHEDYYYSCTPSILQLPSVSNKWPSMYLAKASNNDDDGDTELEYEDSDDQAIVVESKDKNESDDEQTATFKLKDLMLGSIRWYREYLSPIMPPNCRFQPSCSVYAIDAITKFGPIRGGILTAWRILRCNPIGGSGYDPPQWPPVNYFTSR